MMKRSTSLNATTRQASLYRAGAACEMLENRRLLSIVWVNRATTDNFTAAFPGNEAGARAVVDQAIADWNAIILNFNHAGGGNTYNLTLTAAELGTTVRANGGPDAHDGERVPLRGSINLDLNAGGSGWYVDPEPRDDSEFNNIDDAFSAQSNVGAFAGNDLYRTVTHEIGHAVGMIRNANYILTDFLTNTGVDDPNTTDAGNLFSYNFGGGAIEATFTEADSGHLYEGPFIPSRPDLPTHPFDVMTSGRASGNNQRKLVSDTTAVILQQVYGYTIALPSTVNNMLCNPNFTNDVLTVTGLPSNQVGNPADTFLIQGTVDPNVLHVTADGFVEIVPLNQVGSIVVNGLGGGDLLQLEYTAGRFTTFNGGSGVDTLDLSFFTRNLNNITGPTLFNGGAGNDFMHLYDNNNASSDAWSVDNTRLTRSGTGLQQYDSEVENVFLTTGTAANTVNITSTRSLTKVFLNSSGGQEVVNIGGGAGLGAQQILGDIEVQNTPNFTTVNVNDTGNSTSRPAGGMGYTFGTGNTFAHVIGVAPGTVFYKIADVSTVNVTAGTGSDAFLVADTPRVINYHNTGGADVVRVGNAVNGTNTIFQNVNVSSGGFVIPTVIVDNVAGAAHTNTLLSVSGGVMNVNGMTGGGIISCPNVSAIQLYGSNANDIFALNSTVNTGQVLVDAGGGSDIVNVVGARVTNLTVRGGTDAANDFLEIFDASMPTNVVGGTVYADRIVRDTAVPLDVFYSGFSAVTWRQQAQQNAIVVRGTPADIAANFQFSIVGNTVDDYLQVHTQDAAGNPTILGNLSFNGGGGPDLIQVFAGPAAENYRFYDPFGGNTAYLASNGPRWVAIATDVETVHVFGGAQNDTFAVEKYSQGGALSLFGGEGNDHCTIGNGDMSINLTSAAAFTFDGQAGSDRFTIANGVTNTPWTYRTGDGFVRANRPSTGYQWHSGTLNIESQYFFGGSAGDSFILDVVAPGVYTECNGFGGIDGLGLGFATNNVDTVRGPIVYNPGTDGGNMAVYDNADITADTVHLDNTTLGAYVGDTLFGPGGSLTFSNIVNFGAFPGLRLDLGSGADTVYARPLATARVEINAVNPASSPGDSLNLATAGLSAPSIDGTPASGSLTSASTLALSWTGFEGSIATDAVAPAVVAANINVNGIPGFGDSVGNKQAIEVTFSENVAGLLNPSWLQLNNLTTGQPITTANIAVDYVAATNTAQFTFPGLSNGVLPDGNYQGKILAGLPDFFGNPLPADAPFSFFFLNGDANRDRAVDIADFAILAGRFNQPGTFSQGDFNYDGITDIGDFAILASKFNTSLPAARTASAAPANTRDTSPFSTSPLEIGENDDDNPLDLI